LLTYLNYMKLQDKVNPAEIFYPFS